MKILTLNYEFPPVGGGGGALSQYLCRALAKKGHDLRVQTAHWQGLPKIETRDGYTIFRSFSFRRRQYQCSIWEMAAFILTNCLPTLRHIRRWQPDIIHAHFAIPTGVVAWLLSLLTGTPYVLTVQLGDIPGGVPESDRIFRVIKPLTAPIWRRAAAVIAGSDYGRELARAAYKVKIVTIPNAIDLQGEPLSCHQPGNRARLVFAGRLTEQKAPLLVLDLLAELGDLAWELELVGDGPLWEAVNRAVAVHPLGDRIHLRGWVSEKELSKIMKSCDILLMPSLSEALPLVGVKALASGLAILGSDIAGLKGILADGLNGYACPVADRKSLRAALRAMLTDPDRLQGMKEASLRLAARFDLENVAGEYEKILLAVGQGPYG
jgi:glycosyltransferase involved in cell wall biosynthesis